ncbi:MAG: PKD domain-containing protein [Reichenbachiella sp.]|uniref:PKD domain-containing protein n=1 Tax=Reichenbachiella sp. TaxID=2184521 RepID=UPI0029668508|nr:PKD domain-containing protein [Reichenbachiella sp.]MDW3212034.1 PKD domain-containing protein [Reichenbachiella sp.]
MKEIINNIKYFFFMALVATLVAGCEEEDEVIAPKAMFSISEESVLEELAEIEFINNSDEASSYLWSFGDGQTYVGKNATHVYENKGDYTVTLKANNDGQRELYSQSITIVGLVPTVAFTVADNDALKVAQAVVFTNETENGLSYSWEFGDADNSTSTEENPTFTYDAPGDYTVTLTATGSGGTSSASTTITVSPNNFELYFIDNDAGKLRKIDLNNPTIAVDVFDLPGFCMGLAYDATNEEFYYSDDDNGILYRNDLDGTAETSLVTGLNGPRAIALDIANSYAYVNEKTDNQITRVDLTDNSTITFYSDADDADFVAPVGLDIYNGDLYATAVEIDAETVWKGNITSIDLTRIVDYSAGGYGYGLAVDTVNGKVYFDDTDGSKILRCDTDGSNIEEVGTTADRVYGIAINAETGKYYAVDRNGVLKVANLDGTEESTLIDLAVDVRGLILRKAN